MKAGKIDNTFQNLKGKGAKMGPNNYARSTQGEEVFSGSILGLTNKYWCNIGYAVNVDRR